MSGHGGIIGLSVESPSHCGLSFFRVAVGGQPDRRVLRQYGFQENLETKRPDGDPDLSLPLAGRARVVAEDGHGRGVGVHRGGAVFIVAVQRVKQVGVDDPARRGCSGVDPLGDKGQWVNRASRLSISALRMLAPAAMAASWMPVGSCWASVKRCGSAIRGPSL